MKKQTSARRQFQVIAIDLDYRIDLRAAAPLRFRYENASDVDITQLDAGECDRGSFTSGCVVSCGAMMFYRSHPNCPSRRLQDKGRVTRYAAAPYGACYDCPAA